MLFSWHDVENTLKREYSKWPAGWNSVSVYSDSVEIFFLTKDFSRTESDEYLKRLFKKDYSENTNEIIIELTGNRLKIYYEEIEEAEMVRQNAVKKVPLFKNLAGCDGKIIPPSSSFIGNVKVLAFHSYKGGVGRTLSLAALLRECSQIYPDKKFLVIDADAEAPGLTWMNGSLGENVPISYLDLLDVIHYEKIDDSILDSMAELMKATMVRVETDEAYREHYFLPVYRDMRQVMELNSNPETILYSNENKFVITETIAVLAKKMNVDMVLVDLRAGVTELSAPFLFDSRVEKYYVTSTSMQSVYGIRTILNSVYTNTKSDFPYSKVLLTMIPRQMKRAEIEQIEDSLLQNTEHLIENEESNECTLLREDYVKEFMFEERFIHIKDLDMLFKSLKGSELSDTMRLIADEIYADDNLNGQEYDENTIRNTLRKINDIAVNEVTAEGSVSSNMLITSSIKEIARNYSTRIPRVVIMGAKGAGKTFMYKQFLVSENWGNFLKKTGETAVGGYHRSMLILPLTESENSNMYPELRKKCIQNASDELRTELKSSYVRNNYLKITELLERDALIKTAEWTKKWKETMLSPFDGQYETLDELDAYLERVNRKIIFVVDGLEDMSSQAQMRGETGWRTMVKTLCQDVINDLGELRYGNIGIIVLVRRDYTTESITINYEQFRSQYQKYELSWTQTEALRLVLWLVNKADSQFAGDIDILNATRTVIVDKLQRLWGTKLGKENSKEAYSDRWVLAALSGFDGQLQARDIVRFLRYSTEDYQEVKITYNDRFIMPASIRGAIKPCSEAKMKDIQTEMKSIYDILNKFTKMNPKTLPLTLDKLELTGEEIAKLEEQGFIKIADKRYYLPEIIRLGLGFIYEAGARPKVLSLLVK